VGQRVSDTGALVWRRWNGCAEGVERAQWVFGARNVAWGCWWLCRAGGIKAGTREVFRASHLSGLPGLSYLVLLDIQGISMDDQTYWMST
jgi:hypothetical protein